MSKSVASPAFSLHSTALADLDAFTWQAICEWPQYSGTTVIHEGLDYGALTRYFLWDKVPRAIRHQVDPEGFAFEQRLIHNNNSQADDSYPPWKRQVKRPFQSLGRLAIETTLRLSRYADNLSKRTKPVLFIPRQHGSLRSTLSVLSQRSDLRLVAPIGHGANPNVDLFQAWRPPAADYAFAESLYQAILRGLQAFDIQLLPFDQQTLRQQLRQQAVLVQQIAAELAIAQPHALLTFADNHTPSQEYVAIAQRAGIPTVMIQHGLDCERYCLNEGYADTIAVWGQARQQRYQSESTHQPQIHVTGNPESDSLQLPTQLHVGTTQWLWATRPHGPNKCYLPSRSPQEGLDILDALLIALEQIEPAHLTLKPHPLDYVNLYAERIEQRGMCDRVTITNIPLQKSIAKADIVISEDSTAAAEAMFFGKVLIHAHFSPAPPVLPLTSYQAALPATNSDGLLASLHLAQSIPPATRETMLNGQRSFVYDYMGSLDGQACRRVIDLIEQVLSNAVNAKE